MSSHHPPAKGDCQKCNHRTHGSKQDYCSRTGESVEKVKDTKYCVPAMLKCSGVCSGSCHCQKEEEPEYNWVSNYGLGGCSWCQVGWLLRAVGINVTAFSNDPSLDEDVRYYLLCPDCLAKFGDTDYLKSHFDDYINLPSWSWEAILSMYNSDVK